LRSHSLTHVVVGGGAAGFFGAIACAHFHPSDRVILLEKSNQLLTKVRISGGGRCNVTHACFDPALLVHYYPRGSKQLRGPFTRFQPKDTIQWFERRGVQLKIEEDGRMFPVTDNSETIISCLQQEAAKLGVEIRLLCGINKIEQMTEGFTLHLTNGETLIGDRLLIATGSASKVYPLLESLGHTVVPLVPSLFTFNIPSSPLEDLAGISLSNVHLKIPEIRQEQTGPFLITHWGFSGPAVLKLSAWGARELHAIDYQATLLVNWIPSYSEEELKQKLMEIKQEQASRLVASESPLLLPKQLWKRLVQFAEIDPDQRWSTLSKKQLQSLLSQLRVGSFAIRGKTTYKQEFVTCGGINLDEVNFKTMESRICPGLYFAGEILNIDGITGGFNFQNAWTTGWIAGQSMGIDNQF
jgi:predicted Rossmann fold flavoprotein